jgi:hypothetical protein
MHRAHSHHPAFYFSHIAFLIFTLWTAQGQAASSTRTSTKSSPQTAATVPASAGTNSVPVGSQPMDGVNIEAVETYQNPKRQQIDFGLCVLPIDPYYNGFGIDIGYNHYYDKTYSWQFIDVNYIYAVDKGLTSQLAQDYNVNPRSIERLTFIASSNIQYVMAYGKFVFFKEHIRYFRSSLVAGPAFAVSNVRSTIGLNLGVRMETFINDDFSWVLQLRDVYAPSNIDNNFVFALGTAYGF